ncbi:hypothetical protein [Neisseria mucosa]|uniref:hypothetical protein n=1 Tax=Neisseria mucosa TaxID=488 RepID=UPI003989D5BF
MVPKILNAAYMVLTVGKRFGMVDAVADREGLLEEVYRVGKAVARTVFIGEADQAAGFVVMVAEGMPQRIGASCRQTVLAVFVGGFGLDCYRRNISDDLEKGSRSSEKQKQHDYRTHATAEFEVSCGLRLVVGSRPNLLLFDSKKFSYFFSFNHACYGLLSFF